jgi:hypothetical protein
MPIITNIESISRSFIPTPYRRKDGEHKTSDVDNEQGEAYLTECMDFSALPNKNGKENQFQT